MRWQLRTNLEIPPPAFAGPRRARRIRHCGLGEDSSAFVSRAWELHARAVLHDFDHLNGMLYPQRIADMTKFGLIDVLLMESALAALETH